MLIGLGIAITSLSVLAVVIGVYMFIGSDQGYDERWLGVSAKSVRRRAQKRKNKEAIRAIKAGA